MTLHELEIPPGPGASFTSKDGQRPYGQPRQAIHRYDGRVDP